MNETPEDEQPAAEARRIQIIVQETLKRSLRQFEVRITDKGIELYGLCDSFHSKQIVQSIVSDLTDRRIVSNSLAVIYQTRPTDQQQDENGLNNYP